MYYIFLLFAILDGFLCSVPNDITFTTINDTFQLLQFFFGIF